VYLVKNLHGVYTGLENDDHKRYAAFASPLVPLPRPRPSAKPPRP